MQPFGASLLAWAYFGASVSGVCFVLSWIASDTGGALTAKETLMLIGDSLGFLSIVVNAVCAALYILARIVIHSVFGLLSDSESSVRACLIFLCSCCGSEPLVPGAVTHQTVVLVPSESARLCR